MGKREKPEKDIDLDVLRDADAQVANVANDKDALLKKALNWSEGLQKAPAEEDTSNVVSIKHPSEMPYTDEFEVRRYRCETMKVAATIIRKDLRDDDWMIAVKALSNALLAYVMDGV